MKKTLEELKAIKDGLQSQLNIRNEDHSKTKVVVGMATCGINAGAHDVLLALSDTVQDMKLMNVDVMQTGCIGLCKYEPIIEVLEQGKDKVTYVNMTADKAKAVAEKHLSGGEVIEEYTLQYEMQK